MEAFALWIAKKSRTFCKFTSLNFKLRARIVQLFLDEKRTRQKCEEK